ncbi:MAG: hypothetical protein AAFR76_05250 [Planctomycetota bacterium]
MFQFWNRSDKLSPSERVRRMHEAWLDRAIRTGRQHPGIPKREVRLGGFEPLMRTPGGKLWAKAWWDDALSSGRSSGSGKRRR